MLIAGGGLFPCLNIWCPVPVLQDHFLPFLLFLIVIARSTSSKTRFAVIRNSNIFSPFSLALLTFARAGRIFFCRS